MRQVVDKRSGKFGCGAKGDETTVQPENSACLIRRITPVAFNWENTESNDSPKKDTKDSCSPLGSIAA